MLSLFRRGGITLVVVPTGLAPPIEGVPVIWSSRSRSGSPSHMFDSPGWATASASIDEHLFAVTALEDLMECSPSCQRRKHDDAPPRPTEQEVGLAMRERHSLPSGEAGHVYGDERRPGSQ